MIILTTFNARYTHTSLGLRYLRANLKELRENSKILEFVIKSNVVDACEQILKHKPKIVGIGVYIWNALECQELVGLIKNISPQTVVVLGGPEASHTPHRVDFSKADFIIEGEGEESFYSLCKDILSSNVPKSRVITSAPVDISKIAFPYEEYTEHDIKYRYCYVEASRGCPFRCEFCLSSLDKKVRYFDIDIFLNELEKLWERGVRSFKFIDRTFNIDIKKAIKLLEFFLNKDEEYFIHFEVVPDIFPQELREKLKLFKSKSLQLEVGIQTLNETVAIGINRKLNMKNIKENLAFLQNETNAHLHVDLIIGLPNESVVQFGENLNKLYSLTRCEIQVGILKKLSGTKIDRHDIEHKMIYSDLPPYEILQNDLIDFEMMQKLKRFARFWDLVYNSGNFKKTSEYLFRNGDVFEQFFALSEWIFSQTESTWQISLDRLGELIFEYLGQNSTLEEEQIRQMLLEDLVINKGRKVPNFLRTDYLKVDKSKEIKHNKRQLKHNQ